MIAVFLFHICVSILIDTRALTVQNDPGSVEEYAQCAGAYRLEWGTDGHLSFSKAVNDAETMKEGRE